MLLFYIIIYGLFSDLNVIATYLERCATYFMLMSFVGLFYAKKFEDMSILQSAFCCIFVLGLVLFPVGGNLF